jgi:hypothetical protein
VKLFWILPLAIITTLSFGTVYSARADGEENPVVIPSRQPNCIPVGPFDCGIGAEQTAIAQATQTAVASQATETPVPTATSQPTESAQQTATPRATAAQPAAASQQSGQQSNQVSSSGSEDKETCFMNVPIWGCIKSPISLAFVNDALLNIVKPWINGLGELLDQFQNSSANFLSSTPAFWDVEAFQAIRIVLLLVAYAVALPIIGFWTAIKLVAVDILKGLGIRHQFVMESDGPPGTFSRFLIAAFAPMVIYSLVPWAIGINNEFCAALGVDLKDIALPPPDTDNFLVLLITALPYLAFDLLIGVSLAIRFLFVTIATLVSVLAAIWLLKEEWNDLFQIFATLLGCLIFFQLGVMMLLWFYITFVKEYGGGNALTIAHTVFLGGVWYLIWKSRGWMGWLVHRSGARKLMIWNEIRMTPSI